MMKKAIVLLVFVLLTTIVLCRVAATGAESTSGPIQTKGVGVKKRNTEFAVTVESVLQKLKDKADIILIDVRNNTDFDKFRIPGSVNIPLFAIKTKAFLRPKNLILINQGFCYSQLEGECLRLKAAGFRDVSVMFGGLQAWRVKGGPIEGDVLSQKKLNRASARDLFEEMPYEDLVVVNVSANIAQEAEHLTPGTIFIPYRNRSEDFIADLKKVLCNNNAAFGLVLICNQDGVYPEKLEGLILEAGIKNVFYLDEGISGYKRFMEQQAVMLNAGSKKIGVKKCASCP